MQWSQYDVALMMMLFLDDVCMMMIMVMMVMLMTLLEPLLIDDFDGALEMDDVVLRWRLHMEMAHILDGPLHG